MKARMTSSRYGLLQVGLQLRYNEDRNLVYPRGIYNKCFLSTNRFLQFEMREDGIASNRKSASCGEQVLEFCTNRPSRSGRRLALSALKESVHFLTANVGLRQWVFNWNEVVTR